MLDLGYTAAARKEIAGACIVARFLHFSDQHPDESAIEDGDQNHTYRQLEELAAAITRTFEADGLQVGDRVAMCNAPSALSVAFMIAAFARGIVFVNLDSSYPADRLAALVNNSAPKVVYHDPDLSGQQGHVTSRPLQVRPILGDKLVQSDLAMDRPACIFFSSGSTLAPKGILGRYASICHFLDWQSKEFSVDRTARFAWLTALSFDVCLRDVFLPLVSGATLCVISQRHKQSGKKLIGWFHQRRVTHCHVVPSLARIWLKTAPGAPICKTLQYSFFAGEPLSAILTSRWKKHFPRTQMVNLYGPTETTLAKVFHRVNTDQETGLHPCGRPLPDTRVILRNPDGEPVPKGETGEVLIVTAYPSLGYLSVPNGSSNLFAEKPGIEPYATGDLGYMDEFGNLVLCGRLDDQVKVLGVRVEPPMVAAALERHPAVSMATVLAHEAPDGGMQLAALFETWSNDASPGTGALRQHLADLLPMAMIPSDFIHMASLPTLPNGKVNRRALKDHLQFRSTKPREKGVTPEAEFVRKAFCAVFATDEVSSGDDFFSLGGTSLQALEVLLSIEKGLKVLVSPTDFLNHSTPQMLGAHIADHKDALAIAPLPRSDHKGPFALAPSQDRFFRVLHRGGNRNWANMFVAWRVPEGVSRQKVELALSLLHQLHDALRLAFFWKDGKIWQDTTQSPPVLAEKRLPAENDEVLFEDLKSAWSQTQIDVFSEAVFQPLLVVRGDGRKYLFLRVHHLALDGGSMGVLKHDFDALMSGRAFCRKGSGFSFRDFVGWSRGYRTAPEFADDRSYWGTVFPNTVSLPRFPARSEHAGQSACIALQVVLDDHLRQQIRTLASSHSVTPYSVYMAAFLVTMSLITQTSTQIAAAPLACRDQTDLRDLVGNIMAVVPITLPDKVDSLRALFTDLFRQAQSAAQHSAFHYHDIVEAMNLDWDGDTYPITGFSLNYRPSDEFFSGERHGTRFLNKGYDLIYDLLVMVFDHSDATMLEFQFRRDRLDDAETAIIQDTYTEVLKAFVTDGDIPSAALMSRIANAERLNNLRSRIEHLDVPPLRIVRGKRCS